MVDLSLYSGGSFFTAADVLNGTKVLTITGCELVTIRNRRGDEDRRFCLTFDESPKKLVLRPEVQTGLINDFGTTETDDWIGQQIEIYAIDTNFGGRPTKGVRARKYAPKVDE